MISTSKIENNCFQFKADFYPLTVMKITDANLQTITPQLQQTIQKAPQYFNYAPVVLDVQYCSDQENNLDLPGICQLLRQQKIIPIGIRGLESKFNETALSLGLALMKIPQNEDDNITKIPERSKITKNNCLSTKTITTPIRSGTQVYAQGGDLLIMAAVNSGAECIADGNIHIYGPLRGRALAGAQGDKSARIFCATLDAELISIAGFYLVKENIQQPIINKTMTQIYLKDQQLQIEGI